MDPIKVSLFVTIVGSIVSVLGAIVTLSKLNPEKRKLEADAGSSIGDAAQSVADGARVTVTMLMDVKKELEDGIKKERELHKKEIGQLREELRQERQARVRLQKELGQERLARINAENKMMAFQKWLNALLAQLEKAEITPAPPPWSDEVSHNSLT